LDRVFDNGSNFLRILNNVSPDKKIRDGTNDAVAEISKFAIEMR
jgi:hypothetical protein